MITSEANQSNLDDRIISLYENGGRADRIAHKLGVSKERALEAINRHKCQVRIARGGSSDPDDYGAYAPSHEELQAFYEAKALERAAIALKRYDKRSRS